MLRYTQPRALNDPTEMRLAPWYKSMFPRNAVNRFTGEIVDIPKTAEWMEQDFLKDF